MARGLEFCWNFAVSVEKIATVVNVCANAPKFGQNRGVNQRFCILGMMVFAQKHFPTARNLWGDPITSVCTGELWHETGWP